MAGKSQIVDRIAARGASRSGAAAAVDAVLDEITAALAAGERVTLTGFGTFEPAPRAQRTARNPRTGASVTVPATTVARFRPGTALRLAVAGGDHTPRPVSGLDGLARRGAAVVSSAAADGAAEGSAPGATRAATRAADTGAKTGKDKTAKTGKDKKGKDKAGKGSKAAKDGAAAKGSATGATVTTSGKATKDAKHGSGKGKAKAKKSK